MIYRAKVVGAASRVGYAYVAVPQVSGSTSVLAALAHGENPPVHSLGWVVYEGGDFDRPVLLPLGVGAQVADLAARVEDLTKRVLLLEQSAP